MSEKVNWNKRLILWFTFIICVMILGMLLGTRSVFATIPDSYSSVLVLILFGVIFAILFIPIIYSQATSLNRTINKGFKKELKDVRITIDLPKSLYDSLKNSLTTINEETKAEISSEMSFNEFLLFVMEYYLEREEK